MIIKSQQSDVELRGDIKEFKTGIDPKNLEFITTLLSSNLYSNPEQSFIREIVSNAWDSHVEAGNTDTPVLINIDDINNSVTIRDFGVGLSPERFENIYCNIGSSTKRESNDFIGGFGLGRFSALACTNVVYITSYYKGKAYYYIMTKSGNSITTNLVSTLDTTEKDGVEVSIKNLSDLQPYYTALNYIVFFPNIYVNSTSSNKVNNTKIRRYNNFSVASINMQPKLLVGNVLYPCDAQQLNTESKLFLSHLYGTGIVINFKVGEVNITPNRENIIYTKETVDIINNRIHLAKEEIYSNIKNIFKKDYDNFYDYYSALGSNEYIDFVDNSTEYKSVGFRVDLNQVYDTITYKGKDLTKSGALIYTLNIAGVLDTRGEIIDGRYRKSSNRSSYYKGVIISIDKDQKLTSYVKKYLEIKYPRCVIINNITLDDFKHICSLNCPYYKQQDANFDYIVEETYNYRINNTTYINLKNNQEFLDFKKELKESRDKDDAIRDVILYVYQGREGSFKITKRFNNLRATVRYIKELKQGVVLDYISPISYKNAGVICARGFLYITASIPTINKLNTISFTNRVDKEWALYKDEKLSIVYTVYKHFHGSNYFSDGSYNFPYQINKYVKEILEIYNKVPYNYIAHANTVVKEEHPYWSFICKKVKYYLDSYNKASSLIGSSYYANNLSASLIDCYIMKSKLYRINYTHYRRIKNNEILNVLCKR